MVFESQEQVLAAFKAGELSKDVVVVVRFQGPRDNGMPELHKLTSSLSILQNRGHHVGLVTDGRMSGASGTVPAAIHVTPECLANGPLSKVRTGDVIRLDAVRGTLQALVPDEVWATRETPHPDLRHNNLDVSRELFSVFRTHATDAESGARTCSA